MLAWCLQSSHNRIRTSSSACTHIIPTPPAPSTGKPPCHPNPGGCNHYCSWPCHTPSITTEGRCQLSPPRPKRALVQPVLSLCTSEHMCKRSGSETDVCLSRFLVTYGPRPSPGGRHPGCLAVLLGLPAISPAMLNWEAAKSPWICRALRLPPTATIASGVRFDSGFVTTRHYHRCLIGKDLGGACRRAELYPPSRAEC